VLGLKGENNCEKQERERRTGGVGPSNAEKGCDEGSGAILIFQHLSRERKMFDKKII
jgi:hypothetical protein